MTTPPRIAFVAKRKSGKTTAANILIEHGFTRLSLADPVKEIGAEVANFLMNEYEFDDGMWPSIDIDTINRDKATFRPLLEWIGTTFGRDYFRTPDRWIRLFGQQIQRIDGPVVCDDVRFPNEADALRAMGFTIVKIERDEENRQRALEMAGEPSGVMASEMHLDEIEPDITILNDGSMREFRERIATAIAVTCGVSLVEVP